MSITMLPAGAPPLVSVLMRLLFMLKLSAERVIVAGFVAAVPPLTVVVNSVLLTVTNCAEADADSSPAIVMSPDLPAVPVSLPLTEKIDEGGWPLIRVPSCFTFARNVCTLNVILLPGAERDVKAKNTVLPVMLTVSDVILITPGTSAAVPPNTAELSCALLRAINEAGSVDSGRKPEIVSAPAGPAVSSALTLGVLRNTR